jgi:mono/diheme cytochrome c family protein
MSQRVPVAGLTAALFILSVAGTATAATDLLGSSRGGLPAWDYCIGKPDAYLLPQDPRTMLVPGVNAGKAVYFNTFWKNCHAIPDPDGERGAALTCGELRSRFNRGALIMDTGSAKPGALWTGEDPTTYQSLYGTTTMTAAQYNSLWTVWGGFLLRPSNFDTLVSQRYGSPLSTSRNPYPKPFEDPNRTNGGTGQLPEMFTQLRDSSGKWTGRIGVTCHACHTGAAGSTITYGGGSSLADLHLLLRDALPLGYTASIASILNLNHTRGRNNASLVNLAFLFPDQGFLSPSTTLGVLTSGSTADLDTPAWWNMGHRPAKFIDGLFPMDAPRVDSVFYVPFTGLFGSLGGPLSDYGQSWMADWSPDMNTWVEVQKAPAYPYSVNTSLAEQGAVLFHELDMWGAGRNNPVPRPQGNGSCASCHGAYAPRYVNNPAYLDRPELVGQAAYTVPMNIIKTDSVRLDANNEDVQVAGSTNFFGYPATKGTANDCGPQNRSDIRQRDGNKPLGYMAPPLYGVWATAPYLHNGSVPDLWSLLKPTARPALFKRKSTPKPSGQSWVVQGFDTDLARAYDTTKVGWKYDTIACRPRSIFNPFPGPYYSCDSSQSFLDTLEQQIYSALASNLILVWNILYPPTLSSQDMEDRKIFNTNIFGQSNKGHDFNSVLTDSERTALIEYMKTL